MAALMVCAHLAVWGHSNAAADTAADLKARHADLAALESAMAETRQSLDAALGQHAEEQRALAAAELEMGAAQARLVAVEEALAEADLRAHVLRREVGVLDRQLAEAEDALARQLRVAYLLGREDRLKLLLNVEDSASLERQLGYHAYLARAREQQIAAVREDLDRRRRLGKQLLIERAEQQRLHLERSRQLASLEQATALRQAVLETLDRRIDEQGRDLERLQSDRAQLQALVERLERVLAEAKARAAAPRPFPTQRGGLPWPVRGSAVVRFGDPRSGNLQWQGIVIAAGSGDEVRAVHAGRVVFADWLPGYGLVMILDHGAGYLSIYAHNQALFRQLGVQVALGEVIAAVGDTGGAGRTGLYFEIREAGRPVDPHPWLAKR